MQLAVAFTCAPCAMEGDTSLCTVQLRGWVGDGREERSLKGGEAAFNPAPAPASATASASADAADAPSLTLCTMTVLPTLGVRAIPPEPSAMKSQQPLCATAAVQFLCCGMRMQQSNSRSPAHSFAMSLPLAVCPGNEVHHDGIGGPGVGGGAGGGGAGGAGGGGGGGLLSAQRFVSHSQRPQIWPVFGSGGHVALAQAARVLSR